MSRFLIDVGAVTHRGKVKSRNEDCVVIGDWLSSTPAGRACRLVHELVDADSTLLAVCDGLGGHPAGDEASSYAAGWLRDHRADQWDGPATVSALTGIATDLHRIGATQPGRAGMGTTVVGLAISGARALVFNVGDSPLYEYRRGLLSQLSTSDEVVAPVGISASSTMITQSLGPHAGDIDVHLLEMDLCQTAGARTFLLCSDGLSDQVPLGRIEQLLGEHSDPRTMADELLHAALAAGGRDNISVVVAVVQPVAEPAA